MARLGGIKFGMPPPTFKKQSLNVSTGSDPTGGDGPATPQDVASPIDQEPSMSSPGLVDESSQPETALSRPAPVDTSNETPEQEAARRRATLARLRAGGALGFGMFNHAQKEEQVPEDSRGLEHEPDNNQTQQPEADADEAPPPPPPGRHVPVAPPILAEPTAEDQYDAPPPPARPTISTATSRTLPPAPSSASVEPQGPPPPARVPQSPIPASPASPVRTPSGRRPPIPSVEKRLSQHHQRMNSSASVVGGGIPEGRPTSQGDWQIADEPAVIAMYAQDLPEDEAPQPPPSARPPPPAQPQSPATPRRSISSVSRVSRASLDQPLPPTPQQQQQQQPYSPVPPSPVRQPSLSQSQSQRGISTGRPGYDQLKEASATHGAQVVRAAQGLFSQGRKAYLGVSSDLFLDQKIIVLSDISLRIGRKSCWIRSGCSGPSTCCADQSRMGSSGIRTRVWVGLETL